MKIDIYKYKDFYKILSQKMLDLLAVSKNIVRPYYEHLYSDKQNTIKFFLPFVIIGLGFYACSASHRIIMRNIDDIFAVSDQLRNAYVDKPDYWGLSTETILQRELLSQNFIKKGKLYLSGGEEFFVGNGKNADMIMPRSTSFDIILNHLNKAQCISYAEAKLSTEYQMKLTQITISNISGDYTFTWGGNMPLPITKYTSKNYCIDDNNTLIWTVH